jgi:hypothetical protein
MMEPRLECKVPTSEDMEPGVEHLEAPKEHAAVKPVGGLRKWHRGWNLAPECHHKPGEWTQGNFGSRRKLATACRGMTRRAEVAWRRAHGRQEQGQDNVARGTPKGQMFRKKCWPKPESIKGIRIQGNYSNYISGARRHLGESLGRLLDWRS